MKNIFTRYFGIIFLLGFIVSAACPAQELLLQLPQPSESKIKEDQAQAVGKPVVIFDNLSGSEQAFHDGYWMCVNNEWGGDRYIDSCVHMNFAEANITASKVKEHKVYIIPMGSQYGFQTKATDTKIIDFIKMAIDSGRRVIVFNHLGLRNYATDETAKDFIENTMNIEYLGLKPLTSTSGSSTTRFGCSIKGLGDGDPLGLNLIKWLNCTTDTGEYGPVVYYTDLEVFKSKNSTLCPTFDYVATSFDISFAQRTDTAVGIRREFDNGAKFAFYSYELLNMTRIGSWMPIILQGAITWALMDKAGVGSIYYVNSEMIDYSYVKVGKNKTKTVIMTNAENAAADLEITKITFDKEYSSIIYPVDNDGNNIEKMLKDTTIVLPPGGYFTFKVMFKPSSEGNVMRSLTLHTNEPAEDGSSAGQNHSITFTGIGGEEVIEEPYLSYDMDELTFDETPIGSTKTKKLGVFNYGNQDLEVIALKFKNTSSDAAFTIPADQMKAQTIKSKSSITLDVKFAPKIVSSSIVDSLIIYASASNGNKFPIAVIGSSRDTINSVPEINTPQGLFSMGVSPNPASESALLKYNWNSQTTSGLVIKLADNNGNIVRTLFDSRIEGGEGSISIDMSRVASGSYSIIAEINGEVARLPLIIIR